MRKLDYYLIYPILCRLPILSELIPRIRGKLRLTSRYFADRYEIEPGCWPPWIPDWFITRTDSYINQNGKDQWIKKHPVRQWLGIGIK